MIETTNEHSEFWSKVAARYDFVVERQIGLNTRAMARAELMNEETLGDAIEFGCGTGFHTDVLAAKAQSLIATDIAPGMLEVAKQNSRARNITFKLEDCQQTSFSDSTFDTAFLGLVLHFTEPAKALAEMFRILKPGGRLIVLNPDPHTLKAFARFRWIARGYFFGITRYRTKPPKGLLKSLLTEKELCELLARTGFNVRSVEVLRNTALSSNIPIEYIKAIKDGVNMHLRKGVVSEACAK